MRKFFLIPGLLVLLAGMPWARAETAPEAPMIAVRAGVHPDFDRIVFDWPRRVTYALRRDGDKAVIVFSAPARTHFGRDFSLLSRARDFAAAADKDGDLAVSFTVNHDTTLKDFVSDKSVVIDIVNGIEPAAKKNKAKPEAAAASPQAPAPAVAQPAAAQNAKATHAPVALTPPAPAPAAAPSTPAQTAAQEAAAPKPAPAPAAAVPNTLPAADITDTPLLVAALDPHTPVRAAIFQRAGYGTIVFDRKLTLGLDALTAGQEPPRVALEALDLPKASGFRFRIPPDTELHATRDGTAWKMFLGKPQQDVPVSSTLVAQPNFALGSRFLLPLADAPTPVHYTDPVVGDELILVPMEESQAFSIGRQMADFDILAAAQGLVIKPRTDTVIVRDVTDGIEITAEGGLHLSNAADTGASQQSAQKAQAAAAGKSIFDFAGWRGKPDETFTETRQRLQQTIVDVPDVERNRARLELARFYFAHGNGAEAVALLNSLAKQVPDLMAHADFLALLGAANVTAYHAEEGLKDLNAPLLAGQPEIELWQAVAQAELRNWPAAEEKFAITEPMLAGYPDPFHSRFAILAIEAALAAGKDLEAGDWLDQLESGPHSDLIAPEIAYLHGVLHAKAGRAAAAEDAWKEAAASNDRLYKVRAELALVDLGVANGSLTPAQAADQLEAMRFAWRGDDLEADILSRLGGFYLQAKNVKAGLSVLTRALQLYPDSPLAPKIHEEMATAFHDIFLGDLGKDMSPLDALTVYQQYRDLMPTGADGIAVTRNLVERLVAIDLLDQAAGLLDDLVKNKLQGDDKSRADARLAAIYLLDHKPDAALAALDYDARDNFSPELQNERQLLRAKALADSHRADDALALLEDNESKPAKMLRADIDMHAQHWSDAAKTLLDLIGGPPKAGEALSQEQIGWLINCAIAFSLAGDQTGLDQLAIDYTAAMTGTPENDTFRILTQPDKASQPRDIAAVQSRISDVDMFQGFLNSYRKSETAEDKAAGEKPADGKPAEGKPAADNAPADKPATP